MGVKIAPSILAANFLELGSELDKISNSSANILHVDVMDGAFVPPISFGQEIVKKIKSKSSLPLDVHLMIEHPEKQVDSFLDIGVEYLTFHLESTKHAFRLAQYIKSNKTKVGIGINPGTAVEALFPLLPVIDLALIMTVNPGWGGQSFIAESLDKIKLLSSKKTQFNNLEIEVDGGINQETAKLCVNSGADILVAGTYIFNSNNYLDKVNSLR